MPPGAAISSRRSRWRPRPSAPTGSSSRSIRTRTRRSATARSSCARMSSRPTRPLSSRPRRSRARPSFPGSESLPEAHPHGRSTADFVRDRRISGVVPLLAPDALLDELPLGEEQAEVVIGGRRDVHAVLEGIDGRLLVVVGPCSVHDPQATLEYAEKLAKLAREVSDELLIVMRVY